MVSKERFSSFILFIQIVVLIILIIITLDLYVTSKYLAKSFNNDIITNTTKGKVPASNVASNIYEKGIYKKEVYFVDISNEVIGNYSNLVDIAASFGGSVATFTQVFGAMLPLTLDTLALGNSGSQIVPLCTYNYGLIYISNSTQPNVTGIEQYISKNSNIASDFKITLLNTSGTEINKNEITNNYYLQLDTTNNNPATRCSIVFSTSFTSGLPILAIYGTKPKLMQNTKITKFGQILSNGNSPYTIMSYNVAMWSVYSNT